MRTSLALRRRWEGLIFGGYILGTAHTAQHIRHSTAQHISTTFGYFFGIFFWEIGIILPHTNVPDTDGSRINSKRMDFFQGRGAYTCRSDRVRSLGIYRAELEVELELEGIHTQPTMRCEFFEGSREANRGEDRNGYITHLYTCKNVSMAKLIRCLLESPLSTSASMCPVSPSCKRPFQHGGQSGIPSGEVPHPRSVAVSEREGDAASCATATGGGWKCGRRPGSSGVDVRRMDASIDRAGQTRTCDVDEVIVRIK